jgi:hypothetical protein
MVNAILQPKMFGQPVTYWATCDLSTEAAPLRPSAKWRERKGRSLVAAVCWDTALLVWLCLGSSRPAIEVPTTNCAYRMLKLFGGEHTQLTLLPIMCEGVHACTSLLATFKLHGAYHWDRWTWIQRPARLQVGLADAYPARHRDRNRSTIYV